VPHTLAIRSGVHDFTQLRDVWSAAAGHAAWAKQTNFYIRRQHAKEAKHTVHLSNKVILSIYKKLSSRLIVTTCPKWQYVVTGIILLQTIPGTQQGWNKLWGKEGGRNGARWDLCPPPTFRWHHCLVRLKFGDQRICLLVSTVPTDNFRPICYKSICCVLIYDHRLIVYK